MDFAKFVVLGILVALAGCAATGERYSLNAAVGTDLTRDRTRVTVFRTEEHSMYSGRSAVVRVDGRVVGGCQYAGYVVFFVPPGPHAITVDMPDMPGTCSVSTSLLGGEDYFFEVAPRTDSYVAGLVGNVLDVLGGGILIGTYAALAAESAGKSCGGAFSIQPVLEDAALARLTHLRASQ